jgi:predicted dehydrogenase
MDTYKNVGLIECNEHGPVHKLSVASKLNGYNIRKIYINNNAAQREIKAQYPNAEIVDNTKEIINDALIDLVIVSSPVNSNMDIVGEVLEAGKYVRVL